MTRVFICIYIGLQLQLVIFFYKIDSLCKINASSQKFWINYRPFTSVVLCTTPTVIIHSSVLQKPSFCNDNGYKFELNLAEEIGTSVSFWPKNVKCWNFEGNCVPNGSTGKVATWGVLIYSWNMTFADKMQNFFKESSSSALNKYICALFRVMLHIYLTPSHLEVILDFWILLLPLFLLFVSYNTLNFCWQLMSHV